MKHLIILLILILGFSFAKVSNEEILKVVQDNKVQIELIRVNQMNLQRQIDLNRAHSDKRFEDMNRRFEDMNKRFEDMNKQFNNRFDDMYKHFNSRFEDINDRFDDMYKHFNSRFEDINKRFEDISSRFDNLYTLLAAGISTILAALIGMIYNTNRQIKALFERTKLENSKVVQADEPISQIKQQVKPNIDNRINQLIAILAQNDDNIAKKLKSVGLV